VTRLNRNRVVEILRLVGCENLISQRKEFIFNADEFSSNLRKETGVGRRARRKPILETIWVRIWGFLFVGQGFLSFLVILQNGSIVCVVLYCSYFDIFYLL